jgi:ribonuclease P protein component
VKFAYPKSARLRTRRQFQRITQGVAHKDYTRYAGSCIVIEARRSPSETTPNTSLFPTRLGITATRHYGGAVARNRFKRIVREAFRLTRLQLKEGLDLNVKPRHLAHTATTQDIIREFIQFLGV